MNIFIKAERTRLRAGDHFNILLGIPGKLSWLISASTYSTHTGHLGTNPHSDTPCEILHTILLGIDKYIWHETTHKWSDKVEQDFASQLEKLSRDGLSIPSFRPQYIMQFKNSLVGRQFKSLQQLAVFGLQPPSGNSTNKEKKLFELWKANGILGALVWFPEIRNMKQYLVCYRLI